jgi:hypothetical protein
MRLGLVVLFSVTLILSVGCKKKETKKVDPKPKVVHDMEIESPDK